MSKEVLFAGILAVVCLILVSVAFLAPKHLHPTTPKDDTQNTADNFTPENDSGTTGNTTGHDSPPSGAFTGQTSGTSTGGPGTPATASELAQGTSGSATGANAFTPGNATFVGGTGGTFHPSGTTTGGDSFATHPNQPLVEPAEDDATPKTHIVAHGETLADISQTYYNTTRNWKKIRDANPGMDPNALKVGQKIIIPAVKRSQAPITSGGTGEVASGPDTYTVGKDDSYYKIAQKELGNASRWKEIQTLNNIEPEDLHVGQVIKLPSKTVPAETHVDSNPDAKDSDGKIHVVAAGETLSDISMICYGTTKHWRQILKANPTVDADSLKVGEKLIIPDISGSPKHNATPLSELSGGSEGTHSYIVQKNDTLRKIAVKEFGSAKASARILEANPGIDPNNLRMGQKLKIPAKGAAVEPEETPPPPINGTGTGFNAPSPSGTTGSHSGTGGGGGNPFTAPAPATPAPSHFTSPAPAPLSNSQQPTAAGVAP